MGGTITMTYYYINQETNDVKQYEDIENPYVVQDLANGYTAMTVEEFLEWHLNVSKPPVPVLVPMVGAKVALEKWKPGLVAKISTLIKSMGAIPMIQWEYEPTVSRDSALVNALVTTLAITPEELDQLFINAANYKSLL
jgi:hypothetical protein